MDKDTREKLLKKDKEYLVDYIQDLLKENEELLEHLNIYKRELQDIRDLIDKE